MSSKATRKWPGEILIVESQHGLRKLLAFKKHNIYSVCMNPQRTWLLTCWKVLWKLPDAGGGLQYSDFGSVEKT